MEKKSFIKVVLFGLTALLLFFSVIQKHGKPWTFKPLTGVFYHTAQPPLNYKTFSTGTYQSQLESHLKESFGFREPLIRFYNQYLYDFFRTSSNKDIVVGKNHWLYFIQHVNEYYGSETYRWHDNAEEAYESFDREARLMWKLRGVLKEYDVDFLVFMAPEKGFLYPEHLPKRKFAETPINAREYYSARFDEYGFPYIEMTQWFIDMKASDTMPYSLFSQSGAHWGFSAALATDSLMRFMGDLKGVNLPKLQFGPLHESSEQTKHGDHDIENLANLMRPLPHHDDRMLDAEVSYIIDSTTTQLSATFIGTSFLQRMYYFVPFSEVFPKSQYWYYNSSVFYGDGYKHMTTVANLDILERLLESDYVVWFTEGDQMCKASFGFVESALLSLCFSEEDLDARRKQLMNSLNVTYSQARELILKDPERYLPELAGEGIPTVRNPRIPEALTIPKIKNDPDWMIVLRCQATYQSLPVEAVLKMEAQNVLNNGILMRDTTQNISLEAYVESYLDETMKDINGNPELVEMIKGKAAGNGRTYEQQLEADARWIINNKINTGSIYWKPL